MPIKVSDSLPAIEILNNENIFVITETRAMTQDIRPLEIAVLNLMPTKIETETQLLTVHQHKDTCFKEHFKKPY